MFRLLIGVHSTVYALSDFYTKFTVMVPELFIVVVVDEEGLAIEIEAVAVHEENLLPSILDAKILMVDPAFCQDVPTGGLGGLFIVPSPEGLTARVTAYWCLYVGCIVPCNDIVPVAWFVCHCSVEPEPDAVTLVPTRDAQKLRNAMGFEMCIDLT
jgi:hypothetical protein